MRTKIPPRITQIGGRESLIFQLRWDVSGGVIITLNFVPILTELGLKPPYVCQHFQARPYGHRDFGWLVVTENEAKYLTIPYEHITVKSLSVPYMLEERNYSNLQPTAINYFPHSTLSTLKGKWLLNKV